MTVLVSAVERFHDAKAVRDVDPEQLEQHEADGPAFGAGACLHTSPQLGIDVAQDVVGHAVYTQVLTKFGRLVASIISWLSGDGVAITTQQSRGYVEAVSS